MPSNYNQVHSYFSKQGFRVLALGWRPLSGSGADKNISINRTDGVSSLKKIMESCGEHVQQNRALIIFPEGTRVPYGASVKLKKGIFKIIESLKISALVINHDAGKYWSKSSLLIKPGIINISSVNLEYTDDKDELNSKIVKHFNPEAL